MDSTDKDSNEWKGLSDDSDDLNKSISGNFDCFSIEYLPKKTNCCYYDKRKRKS